MAAKKKRLKEKIYPSDWLRNKPYDRASDYDRDFVRVANEVLQLIEAYQPWLLSHGIGKTHYRKLALFLSSYFEDFISEIGLWNTFIARNQELLGKPLPFYDLADYEPGELNPQDLSFLLWYFISLHSERFHGPDDPVILKFGQELYELLEESIDQVFVTDFYRSFLKIPDDIDFFELKSKFNWITFEAYLPALHFNKLVKEKMDEYLEKNPEIAQNPEMAYKHLYGL
ncbi:MAG: DUF3843 family protein, partial [Phaeodactylibacter sp.]|nr:DUF3843 family protein [Phaeodactylibacter sp.]